MGKYNENCDNDIGEWLKKVANELAESNRLKKIQIRVLLIDKNAPYDVVPYMKELEDKAV